MASAHILGFPRIGAQRELKFALEAYWHGELTEQALRDTGRDLRARHWALQHQAGLDYVSVGDFAWYDQVLNTLALLGALPTRFGFDAANLSLAEYFVAARGNSQHLAMEMTKWFDTNYHYLVPEWTADSRFDGGVDDLFNELAEAQALKLVQPFLLDRREVGGLGLDTEQVGIARRNDRIDDGLAGVRKGEAGRPVDEHQDRSNPETFAVQIEEFARLTPSHVAGDLLFRGLFRCCCW